MLPAQYRGWEGHQQWAHTERGALPLQPAPSQAGPSEAGSAAAPLGLLVWGEIWGEQCRRPDVCTAPGRPQSAQHPSPSRAACAGTSPAEDDFGLNPQLDNWKALAVLAVGSGNGSSPVPAAGSGHGSSPMPLHCRHLASLLAGSWLHASCPSTDRMHGPGAVPLLPARQASLYLATAQRKTTQAPSCSTPLRSHCC